MSKLRTEAPSKAAVRQLAEQGLGMPRYPKEDIPHLPSEITSVVDEDLMDLFVSLTAWSDFVGVQVACAQVDERAAQRVLDVAESSIYSRTTVASDRVSDSKARVSAHPDVVAARESLDERYGYRKIVESLLASIERDAALVSREITRRTATTNRRDRWSA
jgi:hypothetical protein